MPSILQIVPRADLLGRASTGWISGSCGPRLLKIDLGIDVLEHGPDEAGEFPGNGYDGDSGSSTFLDPTKQLVESVLSLPAVGHHLGRESLLPLSEPGSHPWRISIAPGGLNEDVSAVTVAGFGDRASILAIARGMLTGYEPDEGHELAGRSEATQVAEFGAEHHSPVRVEAAEAAESSNGLFVGGRNGEFLDLPIQLVSAIDLVLEQGEILAKHVPVFDDQLPLGEKGTEPAQMLLGPVGAIPKDEPRRRRNLRM